ncbi:MAG: hypothetical protein EA355_02975 [Rhodobacteraceae bacterium]|nr:MAG: hypothetical protein EA355_02975 [Paracoccaceae bacterium]
MKAAFLLALIAAPAAADIVPLAHVMRQGAPTHIALVRCAGQAAATAEWIAGHGGDPALATSLAQRANGFAAAAERAQGGVGADIDGVTDIWRARFEASGHQDDAAWRSDILWFKDMALCDEIADWSS